jgi:hypothetical protein
MWRKICLAMAFFVFVAALAGQTNPLTNADVTKMLKAGVRHDVIKKIIESTPGAYDMNAEHVRALKAAGATQGILDAMAKRRAATTTAAAAAVARPRVSTHKHGATAGDKLRNPDPKKSAAFASLVESLQPETCEDNISTVDDCHGNHKTGCSHSQNPNYDAYLNYLKNGLPDASAAASAAVNNGNPLDQAFFANLEGTVPDTLTSTNHGQHAQELASLGEGQIVTLIGTLFYAMASGSETCNCQLSGDDSVVDFHIGAGFAPFPLSADVLDQLRNGASHKSILNLADQHKLEQPSVVVEMTPYYREQFRPGWTLGRVQMATGRQVKVTGQLMFDNAHNKPADDCGLSDADGSKCWRASIAEIHPVTSFQVCSTDQCDANSANWVNLEDIQ